MAHKALNQRKFSLLTSTALTGQAAALGALSVVFGASSAFALDPNALPQDPNVVGGAASFHQSGATLNVNQSTNRTVIDWRSFDIGSNATTNFVQPGASSIAVNRVNSSANPTQIQGALNANGQVWILNPNGVLFGKTAKIDVAGIVASTGNINTNAFMRGDNRLNFTGSDGGEVSNAGLISVADGGLAAFVAPSVRNSGIIRARVGKVTLAAGTTFTLDLAGDQLVELGLGANNAIVDQSGQVLADGSVVNITAKAATKVVDSVINVSGTVLASSAYEDGGTIVLTADNITTTDSAVLKADAGTNGDGGTIYGYADKLGKYDGTFSAQGGSQSGNGGFIETSGKKVQIADGIAINTLAANGATGNWSIDPNDLEVVGAGAGVLSSGVNDETSTISAATVVAGLASTNVTLQANNSITVSEAITSTATGAGVGNLALNDQNGGGLEINLNAAIALGAGKTLSGQGTTVNVGSAGLIQNGVDVAATGGATVNVADGTYNENVTINKSDLTLLSQNGRDATTITGHNGQTAQGAVYVTSGANNFTLGSVGHGFTIIGLDGTANSERAAVYFKGANNGSTVQGNRITANGDAGLMSESGYAVTNLTIDGNIFDGQTFAGLTAGGLGFGGQFTDPNVPRQLVVLGSGAGTTTTNHIAFTNNQVTGTAGGLNASNQEQGNTLVTIDAADVTITGNTFAGTTTRYGDALRARGSNTTISGNSFDGTNMGAGTNLVNLKEGAFNGTFSDLVAANTWTNGSVWFDHSVSDNGNYFRVYRSIQNGVNNAIAGDTINVGTGTYSNALNINKNVNIVGAGSGSTFIKPDALLSTGVTHKYTGNMQTVVFVNGASDVNISGVTIDGNGLNSDALVFWNNASGSIKDSVIQNARPYDGNQTGQGIAVDGTGGTVDLTVSGVTFQNWNKNAIDAINGNGGSVNGSDITLNVTGSTFIGRDTAGAGHQAQNGIVLWERGGGTVNATIDGSHFSNLQNEFAATAGDQSVGILQYDSQRGAVTVKNSTFANVQNYIASAGDASNGYSTKEIDATVGNIFDGVALAGATLNQIYAIEDNILDGLDDGLSGLVRLVANNVFVTQASGNINAGVKLANAGDTVNVQSGTYAGNVYIDKGITLAGAGMDETTLTDGINLKNSAFSDLTFKDFTVKGASSNAVVKQGRVTNFTMDHVRIDAEDVADRHGFASGKFDGAISITNSEFVNIRGFSAFDTSTGGALGVLTSVNFSNNLLDNSAGHITFRQAAPNVAVTIADNIVRNVGDTSDLSSGIFKVFGATTVDFLRNDISGIGANGAGHPSTTSGILDGAALIVSGVDTLNVTGNTFTNNQEAILIGDGNALPTTMNLTGNTFTNNAYDIQLAGGVGAGSLNFGAGNTFTSGAQSQQFLLWGGTSNVDMTNVEFDGKLGSAMTNAELFGLEDRITHGIDNAAAGLVTVNAGNVYVTQASGSIQNGVDKAASNNTINVQGGTYGAFGTSFGGASDVTIQTADGAIIDGTGLTGRIIDLRADGTTLTGFIINGDGTGVGVSVSGRDVTVSGNTIDGTLTGVQTTTQYPAGNATISGNTINTAYGISLQNTGNTVSNNNVTASSEGVGLLEGDNTFTGNTFDIGAGGNALALYGSASANDLNASGNTVTIAGGGLQGAVDLTGAGGSLNVNGGTYAEDVVVNGASRNISFVGATLDKFTTNIATAIGGTVSAVNGFFLNAATTLLSNTVLNGSVAATSIDGSTAGGQTLAVNGGNNALGSLGATTRLGATSISGTTTLNGSTYAANALSFAGPVTLTQSLTTFNTTISPSAAGNITFTGSIFGTTDGAQSVAFIAGPGTGAAGANGDISLQNAGTDALWLGSMDATGDDFSAATVYVGGSYNSMLTGNQTFTSTTLHTRGSVTSNVGGNATGPIVSNGNVNVVTGGGFDGNVTAPTGTIQGQTITGTFTGDTFTFVASQNIDVDVNANSINVSAPAGTVDGTFSTISTSGGSLVVNGQTRTGDNGANPNQIVVEGYTLPAGAVVTPSGEIILPSGMVIGLISPQAGLGAEGGKPKVIIVHSVQRLGELLAQGYVAIIVDLSKNSDETEEIALAN